MGARQRRRRDVAQAAVRVDFAAVAKAEREARIASEWDSCREALDEALRRAEGLRKAAPALGFESLIATVADLIAPLEAFEAAAERVRGLAG